MEIEIIGAFVAGLICGLVAGGTLGVLMMALMNVSARADELSEAME